jgi:hypothetical protein
MLGKHSTSELQPQPSLVNLESEFTGLMSKCLQLALVYLMDVNVQSQCPVSIGLT